MLGCTPGLAPNDGSLAPVVAGAVSDDSQSTGGTPASGGSAAPATEDPLTLSGSVTRQGDYQLFELGSSGAGDVWSVGTATGYDRNASFIVALFDQDMNLVSRGLFSSGSRMDHTMRADATQMYAGVTPLGSGGAFALRASRSAGSRAPAARPQVVYLNFAGGTNVVVNREPPMSFGPFAGATVGDAYAGQTALMKQIIVAAMQTDYLGYNVTILTSDNGGPPSGDHATLHFGGYEAGLLGLADSVDAYNSDPEQTAVVYLENFARYQTMGLSVSEMSVMIANVASHELGHLLGLYHTQEVDDLMDTTGDAWDLATDQAFRRARLEQSVFPTGYENSPALLRQTVGGTGGAAKLALDSQMKQRLVETRWVRAFSETELHDNGCGTCQRLDER